MQIGNQSMQAVYFQELAHNPRKCPADKMSWRGNLNLVNAQSHVSGGGQPTLPNSEDATVRAIKFRMRTGPVVGTRTFSHVA